MIADFFTFLRILCSFYIIYLGLFNAGNFHIYFYAILIGWTTDILDGYLARLLKKEGKLGKYDFQVDLFFEWSFFFYLYKFKYVNPTIFILYNIIFLFLIFFLPSKTLLMSLQAPVTFTPFIIALLNYNDLRIVTFFWLIINLILFHKRFFNVIKEYIEGLPSSEPKEEKKDIKK
ncbi:MAG TPA: CDP-alcohol phosphatidyltransferase family protein [Caldisericia bacterium]|nr:CDP-alcohol phosphatidyltransferase family protein [Caldisericia bacterium]